MGVVGNKDAMAQGKLATKSSASLK
jgi:hypothetical protein